MKGRCKMMIRLVEEEKCLKEVVVIGYGGGKKKELSGCVRGMKGDEM